MTTELTVVLVNDDLIYVVKRTALTTEFYVMFTDHRFEVTRVKAEINFKTSSVALTIVGPVATYF